MAASRELVNRGDFSALVQKVGSWRKSGEHFYLVLTGEESQFIRLNSSKVRQIGKVEDAELTLTWLIESPEGVKKASRSLSLSGLTWRDDDLVQSAVESLRLELPGLPSDPFAKIPEGREAAAPYYSEKKGNLLPFESAVQELLIPEVRSVDLAGIYAAGYSFRALAHSGGQIAWFGSENFSFDYSIYTPSQRALKGTLAGSDWDADQYHREIERAILQLPALARAPRKIDRGCYRVYLAPAAVGDLLDMLCWDGLSESAIRKGSSCLRLMRSGERSFSPLLYLSEDFSSGAVPRFNALGEIAPLELPLIEGGEFKNALISARSANEFGISSNAANSEEAPRSLVMRGGSLPEERILRELDTGLLLSNLHYLNWSDQPAGRATGMTRYACFWVEKGEILSPIENMRWDDSLFSLLGSELEALSGQTRFLPDVHSYERRALGGKVAPGALVRKMNFTL